MASHSWDKAAPTWLTGQTHPFEGKTHRLIRPCLRVNLGPWRHACNLRCSKACCAQKKCVNGILKIYIKICTSLARPSVIYSDYSGCQCLLAFRLAALLSFALFGVVSSTARTSFLIVTISALGSTVVRVSCFVCVVKETASHDTVDSRAHYSVPSH